MQQEGAQLRRFLSHLTRFMGADAYINICSYLEQMLLEPPTQEQILSSDTILTQLVLSPASWDILLGSVVEPENYLVAKND